MLNDSKLTALIEFAISDIFDDVEVKKSGLQQKDLEAQPRNKVISYIKRILTRVVIDELGYDKSKLCSFFGDCTPMNVYQINRLANEIYKDTDEEGKNFRDMTKTVLQAIIDKFGPLDEIKFKPEEGSTAGGKSAGSSGKAKRKYTRRAQKDDSSKVTPKAFCAGIEEAGGYLLLFSLKKPGVTVEALADAFRMKKSEVEHAVCEAIIAERDGNVIPKALLELVEGVSRLRL